MDVRCPRCAWMERGDGGPVQSSVFRYAPCTCRFSVSFEVKQPLQS
jgi:hypothetical protein